ncbi:hypothetical protein L1987_71123 [Smallanthus sonchifolius]|uniref:Uncharacterized protein n=1 Tax=Smallanthus sonchifolius TaxID=185202 RepID=A0ACB9AR79_9ASTR|nr:hypothetical protein L1987_71123 [Smallanthus sonchifolius]
MADSDLIMSTPTNDPLLQVETTCGSLLYELQIIWDEVGEPDVQRDKMLLELKRECLEVYRRKADLENRIRAQLRQAIADSEAELTNHIGYNVEIDICSDENPGSLKAELRAILPELEEMKKRKSERKNQFIDSDRLKKVLDHLSTLNSLCLVLGMDFNQTVHEINPGLAETEGTKSISDDAIGRLAAAIETLHEVKIERLQRVATSLLELWNLIDTPVEEQQVFQSVTCNIAASEQEITEPNFLSVEFINYVEAEVSRLDDMKLSKMKDLVFKKRSELEDIRRKTHLLPDFDSSMEIAMEAIETGAIDPASLLKQIELQIGEVKEEAYSRKEILEKVEKWFSDCEEYNNVGPLYFF